jgi:hypothetical protein
VAEKSKEVSFTLRIPEELNQQWKMILLENKKTAKEVLLNIIEDIVNGDKHLNNKYIDSDK